MHIFYYAIHKIITELSFMFLTVRQFKKLIVIFILMEIRNYVYVNMYLQHVVQIVVLGLKLRKGKRDIKGSL